MVVTALVLVRRDEHHFGGIRIAPSRRITSPFSIAFSMICAHQRGVLVGAAEARRERHHLAERVLHVRRDRPSASACRRCPGAIVITRMP